MVSITCHGEDAAAGGAQPLREGVPSARAIKLSTATFADPAVEARFKAHLSGEGFERERLMQLLGWLIFLGYGALDFIVAGEHARDFLTIRFLIAAPAALGVMAICWARPFRRFLGLSTALALLFCALAIIYMTYRMEGPSAPPYIIGVLVVLVFTSCVMRIDFVFAAATYSLIAAAYCAALSAKPSPSDIEIISGSFFMISVAGIAVATIYLQERRARETWANAEKRAADDALIRQLLLEATAADRSKASFLSVVTHELRTPLHQIIGFSEIVRANPQSDSNASYLDQVIVSASQLLKKLGKMLRYAEAAAGKIRVELETSPVDEIIDRVANETRALADAKNIRIDASGLQSASIEVDAHHSAYALQNLVENAINASPAGAVVSITGAVLPTGDYEIRITDSGVGMTREQIETALAPFAQTDGGLARYREGLGLGLPIASKLLSAQNAALTINSTIGVGTIVSVKFVKRAAEQAA
jgi:signal transduction histidine kinase